MPKVFPSQVVKVIQDLYLNTECDTVNHFTMEDLPKLSAIVALVESIPDHLIMLEGQKFINYVASLEEIKTAKSVLERQGPDSLRQIGTDKQLASFGLDEALDRHTDCLRKLAELLESCPDQFPEPNMTTLEFVSDEQLRQDLQLDMNSMESAIVNSQWKSATVLAGSIVEALLLWRLSGESKDKIKGAITSAIEKRRIKKDPHKELVEWHLVDYIGIAEELGILREDVATQLRLVKNFRNLIHPGKSARTGEKCNRGTALSAVAGVEHVVESLRSSEVVASSEKCIAPSTSTWLDPQGK